MVGEWCCSFSSFIIRANMAWRRDTREAGVPRLGGRVLGETVPTRAAAAAAAAAAARRFFKRRLVIGILMCGEPFVVLLKSRTIF